MKDFSPLNDQGAAVFSASRHETMKLIANPVLERLSMLDRERRLYVLESLTRHLDGSGQYPRLRTLFGNQNWLDVRFENSGYIYDGVLNDLEITWNMAFNQAKSEIEAGFVGQALSDCIRYTLISSSIVSTTRSYTAKLVEMALAKRIWTMDRAISVANFVNDADQKIKICVAILRYCEVDQLQKKRIQELALTSALSIHDDWSAAEALVSLASYLTQEQLEAVLKKVISFRELSASVITLASLMPGLLDDQTANFLHYGLEAIDTTTEIDWKAIILAAFAVYLRHPQKTLIVQKVFDTLLPEFDSVNIKDECPVALAVLIPLLSEAQLQKALHKVQKIHNEWERAMLLIALNTRLLEKEKQQTQQNILNLLSHLDHEQQAIGLAALAPQLRGDTREKVISDCLSLISDLAKFEDSFIISSHNPYMQMVGKIALQIAGKKIFNNDLDCALTWLDEENNRFLFAELSPATRVLELLSCQLDSAFADRALTIAESIEDEENRVRALEALAPYLTEEQLRKGLDVAFGIGDARVRAKALYGLGSYLSTSLLQVALKEVLNLDDGGLYAIAMANITRNLSVANKQRLLDNCLEAALATKNKRSRLSALIKIAPLLNGHSKRTALEKALAVIDSLPDREGSATFPRLYGPLHSPRADALAELAPEFTEVDLQQRALTIVSSSELWEAIAKVLAAIWPVLHGRLVRLAKSEFNKLPTGWRAWVVAQIIPNLRNSPKQRWLLDEGLDAASHIDDPVNHTEALVALLPYTELQKPKVIQKSLEIALSVKETKQRVALLAQLIPFLSIEDKDEVLQKCLNDVAFLTNEEERTLILSRLVKYLDSNKKSTMVETSLLVAFNTQDAYIRRRIVNLLARELDQTQLKQVLGSIERIDDEAERLNLLIAIITEVSEERASEVFRAIRHATLDYLQTLRQVMRSDVFDSLGNLFILTSLYIPEDIVSILANTLNEIYWEWHWQ